MWRRFRDFLNASRRPYPSQIVEKIIPCQTLTTSYSVRLNYTEKWELKKVAFSHNTRIVQKISSNLFSLHVKFARFWLLCLQSFFFSFSSLRLWSLSVFVSPKRRIDTISIRWLQSSALTHSTSLFSPPSYFAISSRLQFLHFYSYYRTGNFFSFASTEQRSKSSLACSCLCRYLLLSFLTSSLHVSFLFFFLHM